MVTNTVKSSVLSCAYSSVAARALKTYPLISCPIFPCIPNLKPACSADTILRAIKELTTDNITYSSPDSGKSYDFNTADTMNELLVKSLIATGELCQEQGYDLDFDHQFIEAEKYNAKRIYKKFTGCSPGVARSPIFRGLRAGNCAL